MNTTVDEQKFSVWTFVPLPAYYCCVVRGVWWAGVVLFGVLYVQTEGRVVPESTAAAAGERTAVENCGIIHGLGKPPMYNFMDDFDKRGSQHYRHNLYVAAAAASFIFLVLLFERCTLGHLTSAPVSSSPRMMN